MKNSIDSDSYFFNLFISFRETSAGPNQTFSTVVEPDLQEMSANIRTEESRCLLGTKDPRLQIAT